MKRILKKLYNWTEKFFQSIVSLFSVILFSRQGAPNIKELAKRIENLDECYLLGTGPSLKKFVELDEALDGKTFMVMNNFFRSEYFEIIKPRFLVMVDPAYYREIKDDFSTASREDMVTAMNKISWEITLIVPYEFKKGSTIGRIRNSNVSYCYINNIPVDGFLEMSHYLYKNNLGMPWPGNVMIAAIFCCINIGFKKIYLLGAEHSWTKDLRVNDNNKVCYYDDHFYDSKSMRVVPNTNISLMLSMIARGFKSHQQLNVYSQYRGCEVINLTENSFIDAYNRRKILEIIR